MLPQSRPEGFPSLIPGDHLDRAAVYLLKSATNFYPPRLFGPLVDLGLKAFDERIGQNRTCLGREEQRVFE